MTQCWTSVRSTAARLTKVDSCGRPVSGAGAMLTTDGYVSISYSPEVSDGDEIEKKNAGGAICIATKSKSQVKWVNVEIEFCGVNPDAAKLITGWALAYDYTGEAVGFGIDTTYNTSPSGFALEGWTDIPDSACLPGVPGNWGYFLAPWIVDGMIGDFTLENDAASFTFKGRALKGHQWGTGPYNVQAQNVSNTPGDLITPVPPSYPVWLLKTTIAPPTVQCAAQTMTPN